MNRVPVALFSNRAKADPIQHRLIAAGIGAEIHDELGLQKLWFVPKREAGPRLEVPAEQSERAEQLLLDWDISEGLMAEAIRCPECHSLRVDYPQFARHSLLTNLAIGLMTQVGLVEKDYYCQDCHYNWPKEGARKRRDRPNMAPNYFIEGVEQTTRNRPVLETQTEKAA